MKKTINLRNLRTEKVSKSEIVHVALEKLNENTSELKPRWIQAVNKAHQIFVATDMVLISSMHQQLEKYETSKTDCNCMAAMHGNPCYHRAYLILNLRYVEANA